MDLSINHETLFKNFKFWGFHTLINSIPSVCIAYLHDWNTVESFIAMGVGIVLFALMLAFFSSMKDVNRICTTGFTAQVIRAGTYFRLILFIIALPGIISLLIYFIGGNESLESFAQYTGILCAPDFVTGIITHGFYQSLRGVIPISGIHQFIPTVLMTILQGCFLMGLMLAAGVFFAAIGLGVRSNKPGKFGHARI